MKLLQSVPHICEPYSNNRQYNFIEDRPMYGLVSAGRDHRARSPAMSAVLVGLVRLWHAHIGDRTRAEITGRDHLGRAEITSDRPRSPGPRSSKAEITAHLIEHY